MTWNSGKYAILDSKHTIVGIFKDKAARKEQAIKSLKNGNLWFARLSSIREITDIEQLEKKKKEKEVIKVVNKK